MNAGAPESVVGAIVFTDLVGFTEYNDAVGDDAAYRVLDTQTALIRSVLERWPGARVVKELGDGVMIWFDTAADALEGAAALMQAIEDARRNDSFPLAVRIGAHYGPALTRGADVVGQSVNIAARVSALAGPGELLVSDHVVTPSVSDLALEPVGPVTVKGVKEPVWLHRVARVEA